MNLLNVKGRLTVIVIIQKIALAFHNIILRIELFGIILSLYWYYI